MKVKDLMIELEKVNPEWEVVQYSHKDTYYPCNGIIVGKVIRKKNEYTCKFIDESECCGSELNAVEI